jgi:hypothetical protein
VLSQILDPHLSRREWREGKREREREGEGENITIV